MADFRIENHGSFFLVVPQNEAARDHLDEHTGEDARWWRERFLLRALEYVAGGGHYGSLVVEHRYIGGLVAALRENGWEVSA